MQIPTGPRAEEALAALQAEVRGIKHGAGGDSGPAAAGGEGGDGTEARNGSYSNTTLINQLNAELQRLKFEAEGTSNTPKMFVLASNASRTFLDTGQRWATASLMEHPSEPISLPNTTIQLIVMTR